MIDTKYILDGKVPVPCNDIYEWGKMFESTDRVVKQDTIDDVRISTVFLGIDHSFMSGPPLLFETMIFGGEHDQYCERYSTWEQAEKGHKRAIELVTDRICPECDGKGIIEKTFGGNGDPEYDAPVECYWCEGTGKWKDK